MNWIKQLREKIQDKPKKPSEKQSEAQVEKTLITGHKKIKKSENNQKYVLKTEDGKGVYKNDTIEIKETDKTIDIDGETHKIAELKQIKNKLSTKRSNLEDIMQLCGIDKEEMTTVQKTEKPVAFKQKGVEKLMDRLTEAHTEIYKNILKEQEKEDIQ